MPSKIKEKERISTLVSLIIAGEAIFFLPFVLARIFRPTMLEVFGISNTELGAYFSVYGIVALVSYVFGGVLADRFPARNLMSLALWLTSLGGIVMIGIPSARIMMLLYGFWGFTTIFLFWAAMIRATREWGGIGFQGRAFGWLEGGRGGTAALLGTVAFFVFSWFSVDVASGEGFHAFQVVILVISAITFLCGVLVWFLVPAVILSSKAFPDEKLDGITGRGGSGENGFVIRRLTRLIRMPGIWLLSVIIICAYSGYKITDDFSLYAREILEFSEVGAAGTGTAALWLRALVAITVGYIADRVDKSLVINVCFALTAGTAMMLGFGLVETVPGLVLMNLTFTAVGIYGLRALYFAVMREAEIPLGYTGMAVGIVSFFGYTPEIFMGPLMGYLLDRNPGALGHQHVFLALAIFALIGLVAGIVFGLQIRRK